MGSLAERGGAFLARTREAVGSIASLPLDRSWQTWQRQLQRGGITPEERHLYRLQEMQKEVMLRSGLDSPARSFDIFPTTLLTNIDGLQQQLQDIQAIPDALIDQKIQQHAIDSIVGRDLACYYPQRIQQ